MFKCTSILVLNALVTFASMCTAFPSFIGLLKEMLSTDAVTTSALQCLEPAIAAAISIQYISRPPMRFPNVLVSLGNTISVIITILSEAFFEIIIYFFVKIRLPDWFIYRYIKLANFQLIYLEISF